MVDVTGAEEGHLCLPELVWGGGQGRLPAGGDIGVDWNE